MREIHFYKMESERCPVEEFLDSLSSKQVQKVVWVLQLVEELDDVPAQHFNKLVNTDSLWEVRVQVAGNIFRILGFHDGDRLVSVKSRLSEENSEDTTERDQAS